MQPSSRYKTVRLYIIRKNVISPHSRNRPRLTPEGFVAHKDRSALSHKQECDITSLSQPPQLNTRGVCCSRKTARLGCFSLKKNIPAFAGMFSCSSAISIRGSGSLPGKGSIHWNFRNKNKRQIQIRRALHDSDQTLRNILLQFLLSYNLVLCLRSIPFVRNT